MKIAIITEVYHPTINGVVISVDRFKNELVNMGHQVEIFAPKNPRSKKEKNVIRADAISLPTNKDYFFAKTNEEYFQKLKKFNPDIIHTQHMFRMGWFGLIAGKKLNIPVVHTYHTLIADPSYIKHIPIFGYFSATAYLIRKLLINQTLKYLRAVDLLITPSNPMAQVLKSYGVKRSINVLATGIDFEMYRSARPTDIFKRYNILYSKKVIVFVGRIAKEKNIDLLLNSFVKVCSKNENLHLLLLGSGPDQQRYQEIVKNMKICDKVTFAGFVDQNEIPSHIKACHMLAFPSVTETQGLVIAEAMAAGLPVVASNRMGQTDIVKKNINGLLPQPEIASFSEAIERMLADSEMRRDFINEGLKTAKDYSTKSQAERLVNLYHQAIDNKR